MATELHLKFYLFIPAARHTEMGPEVAQIPETLIRCIHNEQHIP